MKITLKKAHVLSQRLIEIAGEVSATRTLVIGALDEGIEPAETTEDRRVSRAAVATKVDAHLATIVEAASRVEQALRVAYEIREASGTVRVSSGIARLLALKVEKETALRLISELAGKQTSRNVHFGAQPKKGGTRDEIVERATASLTLISRTIAKAGVEVPTEQVTVDLSGVAEAHLGGTITKLRRDLIDLNEALTAANLRNDVELTDEQAEVLRAHGLVD